MRSVASAAAFALLGTACTAIVAAELKKYDDFTVSDPVPPDPCALTDPDAGNECSACIAKNCEANIAYACPSDGEKAKPWFKSMQDCAQNPYEGYTGNSYEGYACRIYDVPDAQPIESDDDNAKERDALLCVRNNCLSSPTPPCHQCIVGVRKPGTAGGTAMLEDTSCGQCIRDKCGDVLVKCCGGYLPEGIEYCAYTSDKEYATKCHDAFARDAGGPDAKPNGGIKQCDWEFAQSCPPQCEDACP
jgi:hypothetical protein